MEGETELVTIPLSKYNQMLQELANLKYLESRKKKKLRRMLKSLMKIL